MLCPSARGGMPDFSVGLPQCSGRGRGSSHPQTVGGFAPSFACYEFPDRPRTTVPFALVSPGKLTLLNVPSSEGRKLWEASTHIEYHELTAMYFYENRT